jgi:hypothetical protein
MRKFMNLFRKDMTITLKIVIMAITHSGNEENGMKSEWREMVF